MAERSIAIRAGIGASAHVLQRRELVFKRLVIEQPMLIVVRQGAKTLRSADMECVVRAGEAIVIAGGRAFDVINHPSPQGVYEAEWLSWDPALIAAYQTRESVSEKPSAQLARRITEALPLRPVSAAFMSAINRAIQVIGDADNVPDAIARHSMHELLIWLNLHNGQLTRIDTSSLSGKLRQLLSAAPGSPWPAQKVAQQLAMSEATLRRHLAAEGSSLSALLADVRMSLALALLQSTDKAIALIAAEVGYESASRFAIRFRQRFGFSPAQIRTQQR